MSAIPPLPPAAPRPAGVGAVSTPRAPRPAGAASENQGAESATASASPTLLELLTPEERAFFEKQAALGPLTYGRGRAPAPAPDAPLGQRLDVRG
ncbi:MAG: hypothetical protein AAB011_04665 [Candidatus Eisenbacteria bacterium]